MGDGSTIAVQLEFVKDGERVVGNATDDNPLRIRRNRFYFDVGDADVGDGVFDTFYRHRQGAYPSAASCLIGHLEALWDRFDLERPVTCVGRVDPDPNTALSFFLCR